MEKILSAILGTKVLDVERQWEKEDKIAVQNATNDETVKKVPLVDVASKNVLANHLLLVSKPDVGVFFCV